MVTQGTILSNRYLLQDELGAGGMSVVYRAMDLRTGASVAVKIPHAFLLKDRTFITRLKREAQIAATIQSSRIAIVTDVAEWEDTPYFVMEYVAGDTLSELIQRDGSLSSLESLRVALDIARAIDAAHERGVVHRDLKPQNVKITPHGDVKVLDFGIARLEGSAGLTTASLFLGTPDYAAPERTEGPGDIRADVYSIGVILFEMLTGKLPFVGTTPWSILQMHVAQPPPPLPEQVSAPVRAIVERCLAKDPAARFQTPRELVDAIQVALRQVQREEDSNLPAAAETMVFAQRPLPAADTLNGALSAPAVAEQAQAAPPAGRPAHRRGRLPLIVAGATALAAFAVVAVLLLNRGGLETASDESAATAPPQAVPINAAPGVSVAQPREGARVSGPVTVQLDTKGVNLRAPVENDPGGRHIHYFLDVDPNTVLIPGQPIPTGQANIVHTPNASHTFLDLAPGPHSVWAVLTGNDHVPLTDAGPAKVTFTAVPDPLVNARAGEAAPIAYQSLVDGKWRIFTMDGNGANKRRITGGNANDFNPAFSPDGARIAFQSDRDGTQHLYTMNLDGSDIRRHTTGGSNNRIPAWSPDGKELVFQSDRDGKEHLWIVSVAGGEPRQLTSGAQNDGAPSWSRDGTQIVYQSDAGGGVTHVYVLEPRGGAPRALSSGPTRDNRPVWAPDGKRIAFASFRDNQWNIYVMNADGSDVRKLTDGSFNVNPAWAPDGRQLLFQSDRDEGQQQLFVIPVEGGTAKRLTQGPAINAAPSWPLK